VRGIDLSLFLSPVGRGKRKARQVEGNRNFRGDTPLNILRHRNLENSDDARGCPLTLILSPVGKGVLTRRIMSVV